MGERVLLKEGRVGQGGVKSAGRAGNNVGVEFKAWGLRLRKPKIQCFLLLPNPYAPACTTFIRSKNVVAALILGNMFDSTPIAFAF